MFQYDEGITQDNHVDRVTNGPCNGSRNVCVG